MLDVRISDGDGSGNSVSLKHYRDGNNAIVTSIRPFETGEFKRLPFISSDYGENMNVNIFYGASPINVHNGTDTAYWTGTNISGDAPTYDSTTQAQAGTKSIYWYQPSVGSIFSLEKGSTLDLTPYSAITLWIYVSSGWDTGENISIFGFNVTQIGSKVNINNYANIANTGVWQKAAIPIADMGLTGLTISSLRFQCENKVGAKTPAFYLDTVKIEETGTAIGSFLVTPELQSWYIIKELVFFMSDVYDSTQASGTMPKLDQTKLLGLAGLSSGIIFKSGRRDYIKYSIIMKDLGEFLRYGAKISQVAYNGSETFMVLRLEFDTPIILQAEYGDWASITITEDLSGLTKFTTTSSGSILYKVDSPQYHKYMNIY